MDAEVTPEIVRLAYRLILGREPESEAVVQGALAYRTFDALREAFLTSSEFRAAYPNPPSLVPIDAPPIHVEWTIDPQTVATLLAHVKRTWTRLGQERPHWSVLSTDAFTPERIGLHETSFYQSGRRDLSELLAILLRIGVKPDSLPRVLEYGCGIGRVTPHLADVFAQVLACDVSTSHLDMAREAVRLAGSYNVGFRLVDSMEFGMTEPFDLWFSRIVLQHNSPPIIALILHRALRMLAPGGLAIFQVPTYARGYRYVLNDYLREVSADNGQIEMHILPQPVVFALAAQTGCEPVEVLEDLSAGPPASWISNTFVLRKRG